MAIETKTAQMTNNGFFSGFFTVNINNDAANARATVTASMTVYETWGAHPRESDFVFYMYLRKDGVDIATAGSTAYTVYTWLTDLNAGGYTISCSATFNYTDSCTISVGGWSIAYSGAVAGMGVEGTGSWTIQANRPPTPIVTDKESVQMGKKLLFSLNRAYGDYTHNLYYTFGTGTETAIASNVGTSYAWDVPDVANLCTDKTSDSCTLKAITYKGSTKIGETTKVITLTVPDPTTPSISGNEVTMGTASTIDCKRNSSNFKLDVSLEFQNKMFSITQGLTSDTCSWTPSYDLAKEIPALTYGTGTLTCATFNGTAVVGVETSTVKVIVPENDVTKPVLTLDGLRLSPISDLGESFDGVYLRGKTGLAAEFDAISTYSTVKECSLTVGNMSAVGNPATIDLLVNEGDVKVTGKVTDARGFTTTVSTTIYIMPYRRPKVTPYTGYNNVVCERAMDTGELNPSGTYLALKAGKSHSSVFLNGVEMNHCTLRYRWKISSASDYGEWITLLGEGSAESEITLLVGNVVSSLSTSYDVEVSAVDTLGGEHLLTFAIMTEAVSFVLYDGVDGAGFGKYPEEPHVVDIASHMTLRVRGRLVVDSADWVNLDFADGVMESAYPYGRKEDSGCHYLVTDGNHVYVAFNAAFTYVGMSVIINGSAIPEDSRPLRPVCALCPVNDRGVALVTVEPDGYIRVEWVQKATDMVLTGNAEVIWIDGYLDYWT